MMFHQNTICLLMTFILVFHTNAYILVSNDVSYPSSDNYCLSTYNAHLASIHSSNDQTEVYTLCETANAPGIVGCQIGFTDVENEGTWRWTDNSNVDYTRWNPGEPNDHGVQDYAYIFRSNDPLSRASYWDDGSDGWKVFVCNNEMTADASCLLADYPKKLDWNKLISSNNSDYKPFIQIDDFSIDINELELNINVELSYLQNAFAEDDEDGYGTTYWLDFQPFNGNNINKIHEPGSCGNRMSSSYYYNNGTLRDFSEWWLFSDKPYNAGNLGNDNYLSYPNPGAFWELYVANNEGSFESQCSRIRYNGSFQWSELRQCDGDGNTIEIIEDDKFINLTGIFYIDIISPYSKLFDTNYYRVYELLSQPFEISLTKSTNVLSSIGINLFETYLFSVFSQTENGNFAVTVITEAAYYIELNDATLIGYPSQLSNSNIYKSAINSSISTNCFDTSINNICRQIFEINIIFPDEFCSNNNEFDLTGNYALTFNVDCTDDNTGKCNDFVNTYGSVVTLSFDVSYIDTSCVVIGDVAVYNAEMKFYNDSSYQFIDNSMLYKYGEDTVYVEIEAIDLSNDVFDYVFLSLINVWICQYDDDSFGNLPDPNMNTLNGGCLANSSYDFNMNYHIYPSSLFNTTTSFENITNIVRFSFLVPDQDGWNKDKLYIHAEVELALNGPQRRILLENDHATNYIQIGNFIDLTTPIISETMTISTLVFESDEDESYAWRHYANLQTSIFILISTIIIFK